MLDNEGIFQKRLKSELDRQNIKQADLVEKADISQSLISNYMNGEKMPSINNACKIAIALGISLDWLCGLDTITNPFITDSAKMLYYIASIIDNSDRLWTVTTDVVEEFDGDDRIEYGKHYNAAIATEEHRIRNFVIEYKNAVKAGDDAIQKYKLDDNIAQSMKNTVLEKYIKIFKDNRSGTK